ncbi:MAG: hypothetical protein GY754_36810 [bacterium]|nr:hypothetical protein [bacterium]
MKNLDKLFYPESIAVVGASETIFKWGANITTNILEGGYKGAVYPVTKSKETIYGLKAYPTLRDIEESIDLVIIATPAKSVMDIARDCTTKGIKNVVLVSSGFSEAGEEGTKLEKELIDYAKEHSLDIMGPNTMGMGSMGCSLYGTGAQTRPKPGNISIIAQSGNVGNQMMLWAELQGIGIGKFVGSGNEAVLKCEDYIEYFEQDEHTSVIMIYLEGVDDGRKFTEIAKRTTAKKPIVILKTGRSEVGSMAAQSHTGSMAGSFKVFESMVKQTGITLVKSQNDLLEVSAAFDAFPLPKGNRVGVVTMGGGWGVITADRCAEEGLELPPLPDDIIKELDTMLPPFWSRANPVDLVGEPNSELFMRSIELMAASEAFDAVIFLGVINAFTLAMRPIQSAHKLGAISDEDLDNICSAMDQKQLDALDFILQLMEKYNKPIYPVSLATFAGDEKIYSNNNSKYKLIIYSTPEDATMCLSQQVKYFQYLEKRK